MDARTDDSASEPDRAGDRGAPGGPGRVGKPDRAGDSDRGSLLLQFARNGDFGPPDGRELPVFERGEGPYLFDSHGRRHMDGLSGLFCSQLGYSYGAAFAEVAAEQLERLPYLSNWSMASEPAVALAERLAGLAPAGLDRVFFTNGGSEAVESAWKLVRQYHIASGEPQRRKAIARKVAYHGVTLGALALTGIPAYKEPFGTPAIETAHVSTTTAYRSGLSESELRDRLLGEIEETIESHGPETVAMLIAEPIQNAGGAITPPEGYFAGVREICDRHGIVLVCDEVISAFGRIGEWFASDRFGARPDIVTVAKGMAAGYVPVGAVVASDRIAAPLYEPGVTLLNGFTFGGHPVASAMTLRNIEIFERDGILERVRGLEGHFGSRMRELRQIPIVGDVRGAGYFWAAEMARPDDERLDPDERRRLVHELMPAGLCQAGLIARADDRGEPVVQLSPPLICDADQLDEMIDALGAVLTDASREMGFGERRG